MRLLLAGVRYRFATGLRHAMRLWGVLMLCLVIARGLEVELPFFRWGREWQGASLGSRLALGVAVLVVLGLALRAVLQHAMRVYGQEQAMVLPLTPRMRFAIDAASVAAFMLPAFALLAFMAGPRLGEALPMMFLGVLGQTATLGTPKREAGGAASTPFPYELAWLLRTNARGLLTAQLIAAACLAGAELAVRNNDVVRTHSIVRIVSLFAALAASGIAVEITRARRLARAQRALEAVLPIDARGRLVALLRASAPFALPLAIAVLVLRPLALPYTIAVFVALILFGEHRSLRGARETDVSTAGIAAAILAALDARVALVVAIAVIPLFWRWALASDREADLPVTAAETLA